MHNGQWLIPPARAFLFIADSSFFLPSSFLHIEGACLGIQLFPTCVFDLKILDRERQTEKAALMFNSNQCNR
jgi:hypothetical protein